MKCEKAYQFTLNREEAKLLKDFVHNPIFDDESNEEEVLRDKIFNALSPPNKQLPPYTMPDDDIPF